MDTDDNDSIGSQVNNNNGPNDENHNENSTMPTRNMKYNGNELNSLDRNGENMILFKKSG